MVDFIRKNHCYQLGNAGKNQVGMQGLFILGTASCETEVILDMLDIDNIKWPDRWAPLSQQGYRIRVADHLKNPV